MTERIADLKRDLAAAQAEVERAQGIGGRLEIERDEARAEVERLRVLVARVMPWIDGCDSTANDVSLSKLKRDLYAALAAIEVSK